MNAVPIIIIDGLPFVAVTLRANGLALHLERVLIDTGSGGTAFKTDQLRTIGVELLPDDRLRFLRGIGGNETVIEKSIEAVQVGEVILSPFMVQLGAMEYGIPMDGILGFDFLLRAELIIDLNRRVLYSPT